MTEFRLVVDDWEIVDPEDLRPHPAAVRRGDVKAIRESVRANGFAGALVCRRTGDGGEILAGKHRWEAARAEGLEGLPVLWLDVDDATATRIVLVDNRSSDLASNDLAALERALLTLRGDGDLEGSGYDDRALGDLQRLLHGEDDGDEGGEDDRDREVIRLLVPPDAYRRFWDLMETTRGPAHADRLRDLLGRLE